MSYPGSKLAWLADSVVTSGPRDKPSLSSDGSSAAFDDERSPYPFFSPARSSPQDSTVTQQVRVLHWVSDKR